MAKRPRSRSKHERAWLAAATPLFVVGADRRIVFFNHGCEVLTGWTAAEATGIACPYASPGDGTPLEILGGSLGPPPEVLAGQAATVPASIVQKAGSVVPRLIQYHPLRDDQEAVVAVLGLILPTRPLSGAPRSPTQQLHAELGAIRGRLRTRFGPQALIGQSPAMARVLNQLELAQQTSTPLCLVGEPGTGKEHLARLMHFGSPQKANWFVPLECRSLAPDELHRVVERLLEIHAAPAAGSTPQPGTLYLADVEALPRDLQQRLATAPGRKLRLMAGTTTDLAAAVAREEFRGDLYALLTTLTIEVPPLRARGRDLELLAQHFIEEQNRARGSTAARGGQLAGWADDVWPLFQQYAWPGNLDELQAVARDAAEAATGPQIRAADLPYRFRSARQAQDLPPPPSNPALPLDDMLTRLETTLIQLALERTRFNKSKAAELLQINRPRLYRRMEDLGIADLPDGPDAEPPA